MTSVLSTAAVEATAATQTYKKHANASLLLYLWRCQMMPNKTTVILLLLLAAIALLGGQHILELRAEEPRRAVVAMEMVLSDQYLVPKINDAPYYNKPPGFNWAVAACYRLFGSFSEWVSRLPSVLAFLAMAVVNFLFVRRWLGPITALLSSLFIVTSADLLFYGTVNSGEIDLLFSFVVYVQAMALFWFWQRKQWWWLFLISYLLTGIGVLIKPPALLFQAFTLLAMVAYHKQWRLLFSLPHLAGIAVFLAVVGGYFMAYQEQGDAMAYLVNLFAEGQQKTATGSSLLDILAGTASFPFQLLKLMAPWSVLALFWFRKGFFKELLGDPLLRFCALFIAANVWLYWFNGELRLRYVYMFVPFFCVLLAHYFVRYARTWKTAKRWLETGLGWTIPVLGIGMLVAAYLLKIEHENGTVWQPTGIWLISICGALAMAGLFVAYRKVAMHRLVLLAVVLLCARIWFNYTVLPFTDTGHALTYKERVGELLAISGDEPVHWAGPGYGFHTALGIAGHELVSYELTTAPQLAFQLPYYISKTNGHVMQWDAELLPNTWYLMEIPTAESLSLQPQYQIRDRWLSIELVLVRTAE